MRRSALRRILFHLHLYAGVTLGLLTVVAGVTGSLLVFRHEIDAVIAPGLLHVRPRGERVPLQAVVDAARRAHPGAVIQHLFLSREPGQAHAVWLKGEGAPRVYVDPYTGAVLGARAPEGTATGWLFALHTELLTGARGEVVVLIGALSLVLLSVTGLLLWWPSAWRLLRSAVTVKWRAGWRRATFDLHRAFGFWAAGLLCLAAVSGATFVPPFRDWFASAVTAATGTPPRAAAPKVVPPRTGAEPLPVDVHVANAEAALTGGRVTRIGLPAKPDAPIVVRKWTPGELHPNGMNFVYLDPYTARVLKVERSDAASTGPRLMNLRYPVHIGVWGGTLTRVLYVLLGLAPLALLVSGCVMWWNRVAAPQRVRRGAARAGYPVRARATPPAEGTG